MERYLKITVGLLLFVQALHLASLQISTDSPGRMISPSWLRQLAKKKTVVSQNTSGTEEEAEYHQSSDGMASGSNDSEAIASGFMSVHSEEENNVIPKVNLPNGTLDEQTAATASSTLPSTLQTEQPNGAIAPISTATAAPRHSSRINGTKAEVGLPNSKKNVAGRHKLSNETSHNLTTVTVPLTLQTEQPNATISPNTTVTAAPGGDSSRINGTEAEEGPHNSTAMTSQIPTTPPSKANSSSFPGHSNGTNLQTTTSSPGGNETQGPTTKPDGVPRLPNATESTNATTATPTTKRGATTAPITPERANRTDPDEAAASSSERGLSKDAHQGQRAGGWGAILGIGVAVALVALVAYVILKKRFGTDFSHRKLVEEYPSDPVLRLDNAPPLDLDFGFGGSAYYNPGLQKDNIQMDNIPGRR
ncbi:mucin-15 [Clinocottus analis]|uniref:mucin-15 n=1 Tax=Clinocottus analis TaxID=304258 RepID=UPI0035C22E69